MKIDQYLTSALEHQASDLHFISGDPVRARIHGNLQTLQGDQLTTDFVKDCMLEIMDGVTQHAFNQEDAADFARTLALPVALEALEVPVLSLQGALASQRPYRRRLAYGSETHQRVRFWIISVTVSTLAGEVAPRPEALATPSEASCVCHQPRNCTV